jgi:hypothetical protein
LDAYRVGTHAIKETTEKFGKIFVELNNIEGLSVEAVNEVMVELEEVFAGLLGIIYFLNNVDQKEIDEALKATPTTEMFDEEELENELDQLLKEDEKKNQEEQADESLVEMINSLKVHSSPIKSPIKSPSKSPGSYCYFIFNFTSETRSSSVIFG